MSNSTPSDLPASPTPGSSLRDQIADAIRHVGLARNLASYTDAAWAVVQPELDAKDAEIAALRAGESPEPGGDVPQAWTPAQWIYHWNRLPADERLATVRRIYDASGYMAACILERHEEQIAALTRRAEQAEAAIARVTELRDKWLRWPADDPHHAAGLMLSRYLDQTPRSKCPRCGQTTAPAPEELCAPCDKDLAAEVIAEWRERADRLADLNAQLTAKLERVRHVAIGKRRSSQGYIRDFVFAADIIAALDRSGDGQ